ncbi:hypothetical protein LP417_05175 [Polaromonas sp. P1-6]|nr:hypothetical protein LP417_05175 [Polaromonas sp. P1-6]
MAMGRRPEHRVTFDMIPEQTCACMPLRDMEISLIRKAVMTPRSMS